MLSFICSLSLSRSLFLNYTYYKDNFDKVRFNAR